MCLFIKGLKVLVTSIVSWFTVVDHYPYLNSFPTEYCENLIYTIFFCPLLSWWGQMDEHLLSFYPRQSRSLAWSLGGWSWPKRNYLVNANQAVCRQSAVYTRLPTKKKTANLLLDNWENNIKFYIRYQFHIPSRD